MPKTKVRRDRGRQMTRRERKLYRVAIHEAGHAIMAVRWGVAFRFVTIVPDEHEGTRGHVQHYIRSAGFEFDPSANYRSLNYLTLRAIVCFAGMEAERRIAGRYDWRGAKYDLSTAAELAFGSVGAPKAAEKLLAFWRQLAKDAVAAAWPEIQGLAGELMKRQRMTGRDVKVFLRSGLRAPRAR